jgi:hypothetical protein
MSFTYLFCDYIKKLGFEFLDFKKIIFNLFSSKNIIKILINFFLTLKHYLFTLKIKNQTKYKNSSHSIFSRMFEGNNHLH